MSKVFEYEFNGYKATVIRPDKPNGKWIWKTEFFYAFDNAENELLKLGYTRVYYQISDMYGCPEAVNLMRKFYFDVIKKFDLKEKCCLFGFSRGGLYAFNFAIKYPESVDKIYLDNPVLDLHTWPPKGGQEYNEMLACYNLNEKTFNSFNVMPVNMLQEFFNLNIPLLLIAGDSDSVVNYDKNSKKIIEYCKNKNIKLSHHIKLGGEHIPHSLEDVSPILNFVENGN